jgi:hypothetical protein
MVPKLVFLTKLLEKNEEMKIGQDPVKIDVFCWLVLAIFNNILLANCKEQRTPPEPTETLHPLHDTVQRTPPSASNNKITHELLSGQQITPQRRPQTSFWKAIGNVRQIAQDATTPPQYNACSDSRITWI